MRFLALLLLATLPLTSCATMMGGGGPWHVPVDSVPPGATVNYDGANVGVTPCTVVMSRRSSQMTLRREGFHDQVVEVRSGGNPMILGNLLFGGIVGVMIDAGSGASGTMDTRPCWVELTPLADPRPGTWRRPPSSDAPTRDDEGWVREGEAKATAVAEAPPKPTRAPAWTPPPPPAADDGWVRHGDGY